MNKGMRRLIPVCTLATMAMSNVAMVLAAEAPGASRLTEPVTLNEKSARGLLVSPVSPEYPPLAKINYIQGKVRLQLLVSREGKVVAAHVVKGNPLLAAPALKAVRAWLYRPLQTAAGPAEFLAPVEVEFALQYRKAGLFPPRAEQDFSRQVRAPEIVARPDGPQPSSAVRLRVLVNEEGRPVDYELLSGQPLAFDKARQVVDGWKFRPASWGTLAVPWYLEVDVPGGDSFRPSTGPEVGSR
jgi:TonB family protein